MYEFEMIVILPLLRRNTDLGLNGHHVTNRLIKDLLHLKIDFET